MKYKRSPSPCMLALAVHVALLGTANAAEADRNVFTLGQITVTGQAEDGIPVGTATLDREQLWDFARDAVPDALNIMPGVISTPGDSRRNETVISVRGFNRLQVPLLMDGIRLYLPADNRIDFDRFLTPDLSEIQVSKGYVSVLNGPDGMGGAINLVTRKPVEPFEAEVRASAALAGKGQYNGYTAYANVGSRQETHYYQASIQQRDVDQWRLSDDFRATQLENGGKRDNSAKKDWRINLKAGFTPNASDEYSLNFVKQKGEKTQVSSTINNDNQWWEWPEWDTWSLYWLSHTELGNQTWLKSRVYYNKFDNTLVINNLASNNACWQSTGGCPSIYDDSAWGGSVEVGTRHFNGHTIKGALHYRRDEHTEWNVTRRTGFREPKQDNVEDVWSAALEETWHLTPQLDLVAGISRDMRNAKKAEDFTNNAIVDYDIADKKVWNYQGAVIYRYRPGAQLHFSASERTRFPTIFERFSTRFGNASSNPWLDPERALNLELGIEDQLTQSLRGSAAVFHSKVKDAIQSVPTDLNGNGIIERNENQFQNVGKARFKGFEFALEAKLSPQLNVGGNYTYIDSRLDDPTNISVKLTTTPRHKAFAYAKWRPSDAFTVIPALEYASRRWSEPAITGSGYTRTDDYTLLNLKLDYRLARNWELSLTARNLFDKNYEVTEGYPQEGRNFVLATRYQF